jgi:hypothetical protein
MAVACPPLLRAGTCQSAHILKESPQGGVDSRLNLPGVDRVSGANAKHGFLDEFVSITDPPHDNLRWIRRSIPFLDTFRTGLDDCGDKVDHARGQRNPRSPKGDVNKKLGATLVLDKGELGLP